jgi:hypothetical protein
MTTEEESHEAKWRMHDCQCDQRTDGAIWRCSKDKEWLDGIAELEEKCEIERFVPIIESPPPPSPVHSSGMDDNIDEMSYVVYIVY